MLDDFSAYLREHTKKEKTLTEVTGFKPFKLNPVELEYLEQKKKPVDNWSITPQGNIKPIKEYILDRDDLEITKKLYGNVRTLILRGTVTVVCGNSPLSVDYGLNNFYKEWRAVMDKKLWNAALGSTSYVLKRLSSGVYYPYLFFDGGLLKGIVVDYYRSPDSYRLISIFLENRQNYRSPMIAEYGNLWALWKSPHRYLNFGGDVSRKGLKEFKERITSKYISVWHSKERAK